MPFFSFFSCPIQNLVSDRIICDFSFFFLVIRSFFTLFNIKISATLAMNFYECLLNVS